MKNKIFVIVVMVSTTVFLCSCHKKERALQLQRIDSLDMKLNEVDSLLSIVSMDSLSRYYADIASKDSVFILFSGKMTEKEQNDVAMYNRNSRFFPRVIAAYNTTKKGIAESKEQLKNLRNDVENRAITQEEFDRYIDDEAHAVARLGKAKRHLRGAIDGVTFYKGYKIQADSIYMKYQGR